MCGRLPEPVHRPRLQILGQDLVRRQPAIRHLSQLPRRKTIHLQIYGVDGIQLYLLASIFAGYSNPVSRGQAGVGGVPDLNRRNYGYPRALALTTSLCPHHVGRTSYLTTHPSRPPSTLFTISAKGQNPRTGSNGVVEYRFESRLDSSPPHNANCK